MSETGEKSLWGKVTSFFKKEQTAPIITQARPMTPEEDLAQLKDWQGPKGRAIIQAESRARQAINKKKEQKGRKIANAVIVGTAIAGGVTIANPPDLLQAVQNIGQGIVDTRERLRNTKEPGTALSDQAKKNLDNRPNITIPAPSSPIENTTPFPDIHMKGPQAPVPDIPGLEKPKPA